MHTVPALVYDEISPVVAKKIDYAENEDRVGIPVKDRMKQLKKMIMETENVRDWGIIGDPRTGQL